MTRLLRLMLVALPLALAVAPAAQAQASPRVRADVDLETLLARMTTAEKIGQLVQRTGGRQRALNSRLGPEELDKVRRGEVGSYLHVAGAEPLRELQRVAVEESRLGIPLLFAMDVVHGYRTIYPVPLAMAATWDTGDAARAARMAAVEASAAGLHWISPRWSTLRATHAGAGSSRGREKTRSSAAQWPRHRCAGSRAAISAPPTR